MSSQVNKQDELLIIREFNAPKNLVFNAFADADALAQWWGPPGVPIKVLKFQFKNKGVFHYETSMQGQSAYGKFVYGQIKPTDLIEFTSSFADSDAEIIRAPFSDKFPMQIFNRIEFTEVNGKTKISHTGYPVNASDEELQFFTAMQAGIQQGFAGTFNQLEAYLEKNK